MEKVTPRTLSGFMELLPERQVLFDKMVEALRASYALYGFTPLDTPLIESSEVLLAKGGGETEKQIYRFTKGDSDLSLRFDLTVPLAKYVALHGNDLTFPFRRYQIGKVYRGERAQRGRFREFYQADIDVIGDGTLDIINEAEIPSIIYRCFDTLGLKRFVIRVNNRKVLNGLFELLGVGGKAGDVMRTIDKLDKLGREKVLGLLENDVGVPEDVARRIVDIITCQDTGADPIEKLGEYRGRNAAFDLGLEELATVTKYMSAFGVPETHFTVDLTIARGLDYYTGTVYETAMLDHPEIGSICSGGRYDNLAGYYTDRKLPGVGISIGLTRLFFVLEDQGYLNGALLTAPADVLILPMTEDRAPAIALATMMRQEGLRVQVYSENKKFKAKVSYADKLKIPFAVFLGEDEISQDLVTVKDMATGAQTTASAAMVTAAVKAKISGLREGAPVKEPQK
ncbi:histidyl-tRNA synthetase [Sporobacter termitidis DSM 10068]|uniref:Histidine--tRNA ligase n=1 Tax=Sporobacter termitidis DSM 10068 TaxID=1123282 RepID=A0A1M5VMT7_9FIRM|nr:histidine--tRNA ligase [Sporobacter termitidis]SHH76549.1 histidyl-tRNA synthetase [Sporobacter termitidis DSM 10068]